MEHLVGAQSLFSSLDRLFSLRNYSFHGIILALIWFLSPLGGQALLRLLSTHPTDTQIVQNATYLSPDFLSGDLIVEGDSAQSSMGLVTALYSSSLLSSSSTRLSPRDSWDNPKIPLLRSVNGGNNTSDWSIVASQPVKYSNLLGVPSQPPRTNGSSQFTISAIYLDVECSSLEFTDTVKFHDSLHEPLFWARTAGGGTYPNGTTIIQFQKYTSQEGHSTTFLYMTNSSWNAHVANISHPITLYYGSQAESQSGISFQGEPISLATCTMVPLTVNANTSCIDQECSITSMRSEAMSDAYIVGGLFELFENGAFCGMGASGHPYVAEQTENFISGLSDQVEVNDRNRAALWNMTLSDFEERFSQAINAYWYASSSLSFTSPLSAVGPLERPTLNATALVFYDTGNHYKCDQTWFGLALMALLILEAVSVACISLRFWTYVPDVFGYVTSLTIGNRFCQAVGLVAKPESDGIDRAKKFGEYSFRLVKVEENGNCELAFMPYTTKSAPLSPG